MGSIKNVVSEPIEGHEDYHMMVSAEQGARGAEARTGHLVSSATQNSVRGEPRSVEPATPQLKGCQTSASLPSVTSCS